MFLHGLRCTDRQIAIQLKRRYARQSGVDSVDHLSTYVDCGPLEARYIGVMQAEWTPAVQQQRWYARQSGQG